MDNCKEIVYETDSYSKWLADNKVISRDNKSVFISSGNDRDLLQLKLNRKTMHIQLHSAIDPQQKRIPPPHTIHTTCCLLGMDFTPI